MRKIVLAAAALSLVRAEAGWVDLLADRNLAAWQSAGDGLRTVWRDGTLVGQRDRASAGHQAWLYTAKEFGDYDLTLEYRLSRGSNSGVSIRDASRARWAHGAQWDPERTPSHIGYEVQLSNGGREAYPSGSIYLFVQAPAGLQSEDDWNRLEITSRAAWTRVRLNGRLAAEFAGQPGRPTAGPIGLQLHEQNTPVMFRSIRIRELRRQPS